MALLCEDKTKISFFSNCCLGFLVFDVGLEKDQAAPTGRLWLQEGAGYKARDFDQSPTSFQEREQHNGR